LFWTDKMAMSYAYDA